MFSDRLLEARKQAGLSQRRLAALLGERYDRSMIGHVENGRRHLLMDGAMKAAQVLDVSLDYLVGLSDDPTPTAESAAELQRTKEELDRLRRAAATPEHPDPDVSPIQSAPGWHDEDYESVRRYESEDVALAAGTGTFADQEPVPSEVKFLKSWLRDHRLRAKDLFLVDVSGDSMETTIYDGDSALVDESRTSPRSGRIYALRTGDGLLVKRLRKRDHRWWADSDNEEYEPQPLDDRARIMGRVVWWAHTD